jgi:adenine-specific DNA-methyltransferase
MPTLDWIGKKAVVDHHRQVPYHLLRCDPALSVGEAGSGNLLVEGDNLLALKALLPYYAGQVKCIYIDPPYNTGNENWVYNDAVNGPEMRAWLGRTVGGEAEDLSRHDKWLCMMYPRLQLLKQFLTEDGTIWMSLDDNEIGHARSLFDEVFGERNFLATVIWQKRTAPDARLPLGAAHDYILVYAIRAELAKKRLHRIPLSGLRTQDYKNPDNDPRGNWASVDLTGQVGHATPAQFFEIVTPSGRKLRPPEGRCWALMEGRFNELRQDNRIWFGRSGDARPRLKNFISETQGSMAWTWWPNSEVGHNQEATKELMDLLEGKFAFETPKPTRLLERILQLATDTDSLILDSFAGSGTTGHATVNLNRMDQGRRRFLLVEMDASISTEVTRARLERVVTRPPGTADRGAEAPEGGFRYCRLGQPLFDEVGRISKEVTFGALAHHIYFTETGEPLPGPMEEHGPLLGVAGDVAYYLLFNGGRRNVLDAAALAAMPPHKGPRVVYADGCRLSRSELDRLGVTFKQIPYQIRTT